MSVGVWGLEVACPGAKGERRVCVCGCETCVCECGCVGAGGGLSWNKGCDTCSIIYNVQVM